MAWVPSIVVLVNMRPCSESEGQPLDDWLQYLQNSGGTTAAQAIRNSGDSEMVEWVTSTSPNPGVDGLARPRTAATAIQAAGGIVRLLVRRGKASGACCEKLKPSKDGSTYNGLAVVIPGVTLSPFAQSVMTVDPTAESRSHPRDFHLLFADAATCNQVIHTVLDGVEMVSNSTGNLQSKRRRGSAVWGVARELVIMCQGAAAQPQDASELLSTGWNAADARCARPANPTDLLSTCLCKDTSYKFADWLHHGCPAGILRPGPLLDYRGEPSALLATLRHNALFEVLSGLRVHPIARSHVHRGIIPEDDPTVFRVAATFQPAEAAPISALTWHATDKHRVAFVINTADVHDSAAWERHATPANQGTLWGKGCILFVRAAPLSLAGKWRITLAPASPITGDVLVVLLHWIGNSFFADEAIRRASLTGFACALASLVNFDPSQGVLRCCQPSANHLHGMLSNDVIASYEQLSGITLDSQQRGILESMNKSTKPLYLIRALAGVGKTALAHCILHAFINKSVGHEPRTLALLTVPTRELREEVLLDIIRSKARLPIVPSK